VAVLTVLAQPLAQGRCRPVRIAALRYLADMAIVDDHVPAVARAITDNPHRIAYFGGWRVFTEDEEIRSAASALLGSSPNSRTQVGVGGCTHALPALRTLAVRSHSDVPEVQNSRSRDPDQFCETAPRQQQDIVENLCRHLKFAWAEAVVPRHVRQVEQIERGLDVRGRELPLDAGFAFLAALRTSNSHRILQSMRLR
jgi:hypothetical protein